MSEWLYVLDLETTGLDGRPHDKILELGLAKINIFTHEIIPLMSEIIYQDVEDPRVKHCWVVNNNIITLKEIIRGKQESKILDKAKELIGQSDYTTYNTDFDYFRFLYHYKFKPPKFCLMKRATDIVRIPHHYSTGQYKWPTLQESYDRLVLEKLNNQNHRALDDVLMSIEVYKAMQRIQMNTNQLKQIIQENTNQQITISYKKKKGEFSKRTIIPKVLNDNILEAHCLLRNDIRNFNINRIQEISL